jgi:hypothetical protein
LCPIAERSLAALHDARRLTRGAHGTSVRLKNT